MVLNIDTGTGRCYTLMIAFNFFNTILQRHPVSVRSLFWT
jgi:hypothetical protein